MYEYAQDDSLESHRVCLLHIIYNIEQKIFVQKNYKYWFFIVSKFLLLMLVVTKIKCDGIE